MYVAQCFSTCLCARQSVCDDGGGDRRLDVGISVLETLPRVRSAAHDRVSVRGYQGPREVACTLPCPVRFVIRALGRDWKESAQEEVAGTLQECTQSGALELVFGALFAPSEGLHLPPSPQRSTPQPVEEALCHHAGCGQGRGGAPSTGHDRPGSVLCPLLLLLRLSPPHCPHHLGIVLMCLDPPFFPGPPNTLQLLVPGNASLAF